ncbi:hypothetical protein IBX73_02555 [candidate division WOR-3 bacterium]|nr:hypothetical protein [candidate division WOR-3 bacterium]
MSEGDTALEPDRPRHTPGGWELPVLMLLTLALVIVVWRITRNRMSE